MSDDAFVFMSHVGFIFFFSMNDAIFRGLVIAALTVILLLIALLIGVARKVTIPAHFDEALFGQRRQRLLSPPQPIVPL